MPTLLQPHQAGYGKVLQVVTTKYQGLFTSSPGAIPNDDTPPLWNEGAEVAGLATTITPKFSTSTLLVIGIINMESTSSGGVYWYPMPIFRDPVNPTDEALAIVATSTQLYGRGPTSWVWTLPASDTNTRTYKFRIGASAGSLSINARQASGNPFGGTAEFGSIINIMELSS